MAQKRMSVAGTASVLAVAVPEASSPRMASAPSSPLGTAFSRPD